MNKEMEIKIKYNKKNNYFEFTNYYCETHENQCENCPYNRLCIKDCKGDTVFYCSKCGEPLDFLYNIIILNLKKKELLDKDIKLLCCECYEEKKMSSL